MAVVLSIHAMQRLWPHHCLAWTLLAVGVEGCRQVPQDDPADNTARNQSQPTLPLPVAEPPMDRQQLIMAVVKAASAAALGQNDTAQQRSLGGTRFAVRIRFGCPPPPEPGSGSFGVQFDEKDRALRIRAAPDLTLDNPKIAEIAGPAAEAIEGFWVTHPWLLTDGCPTAAPQSASVADGEAEQSANQSADEPPPPVASPTQQIGIAQFFTEADSRTNRRERRPYQVTKVLADGEQPSSQGYNLVLSGRLRPVQGKVINCRSDAIAGPPACVVSAQFDRVFIERPDNREVLAEWTN